jgi:hypothetical protein
MLRGLIISLLLSSSIAFANTSLVYDFPSKPDPEITTGDLCNTKNPDFTEYRYAEKIAYCVRNVDFARKQKVYEEYGVPEKCRREYTIDHFIPLALGGSNEITNLWPEHKNVKATRQTLEQELFDKIRDGQITQAYAIRVIVHAKRNPPHAEPAPCN